MSTIKVNKSEAIKAIKKALNNKKLMQKFLNGEISRAELEKKGIKLADAL